VATALSNGDHRAGPRHTLQQFNLISLGDHRAASGARRRLGRPSPVGSTDNDAPIGFVNLPGGATPTISPSDAARHRHPGDGQRHAGQQTW
jgi:hypothetical protein